MPVALLDDHCRYAGRRSARLIPPLADKAELARIGRYYATESMLVWDAARQRYDADATPSIGTETLADYYAKLLRGEVDGRPGRARGVLARITFRPTARTPKW